jgi:hypothetical protein
VLLESPSGKDGVIPLLEVHLRAFACEIIQRCGQGLKL